MYGDGIGVVTAEFVNGMDIWRGIFVRRLVRKRLLWVVMTSGFVELPGLAGFKVKL